MNTTVSRVLAIVYVFVVMPLLSLSTALMTAPSDLAVYAGVGVALLLTGWGGYSLWVFVQWGKAFSQLNKDTLNA